jgi:hypothetical protein
LRLSGSCISLSFAPTINKYITVNLGSLDDLDLPDLNVLNRIDLASFTLNLVVNNLSCEVIQYLIDIALVDLLVKNFDDFLANSLDL